LFDFCFPASLAVRARRADNQAGSRPGDIDLLLACLIASAIAASAPGQAPPSAAAAAPAGPAPSIESVLQKLQETAPGDADEEGAEAPPAAPIPPPAPLRNIPPPSARATPYADLDARA